MLMKLTPGGLSWEFPTHYMGYVEKRQLYSRTYLTKKVKFWLNPLPVSLENFSFLYLLNISARKLERKGLALFLCFAWDE